MVEIRAIVPEEIRDQINTRMALMRENGSRKSFPEVAGDLLEQKISASIIFPIPHSPFCPAGRDNGMGWKSACICRAIEVAESEAALDEKLNG